MKIVLLRLNQLEVANEAYAEFVKANNPLGCKNITLTDVPINGAMLWDIEGCNIKEGRQFETWFAGVWKEFLSK